MDIRTVVGFTLLLSIVLFVISAVGAVGAVITEFDLIVFFLFGEYNLVVSIFLWAVIFAILGFMMAIVFANKMSEEKEAEAKHREILKDDPCNYHSK